MSTYNLGALAAETQYGASPASHFDKLQQAYQNGLVGVHNKANFSVSHLLDLEELPRENCAMYANTAVETNNNTIHTNHNTSPVGATHNGPSSCAHSNIGAPVTPEDDRKSGKRKSQGKNVLKICKLVNYKVPIVKTTTPFL